jgi:hypothetical protein
MSLTSHHVETLSLSFSLPHDSFVLIRLRVSHQEDLFSPNCQAVDRRRSFFLVLIEVFHYLHSLLCSSLLSTFQLQDRNAKRERENRVKCNCEPETIMSDLFLDENKRVEREATTTGRCNTTRLQPPKRDQAQPALIARGNRFGFRQNVVRPAAVGIMPKFNEYDDSANNNTTAASAPLLDNVQRRSKSATAATRSHVMMAQPTVKTVSEERSHTTNAR